MDRIKFYLLETADSYSIPYYLCITHLDSYNNFIIYDAPFGDSRAKLPYTNSEIAKLCPEALELYPELFI